MRQMPKNTHTRALWMVWATWLINLYPACWHERYADEMLAILEEHPPTFWTLGDILVSLCDAHLHHAMVSGRMLGMFKQFYSSVTTIFSIGLMFCLFSFAIVQYLTNILRYPSLQRIPIPIFFHPVVLLITYILYMLLILLIVCGTSLFWAMGWKALKAHHLRAFFLYLFSALSPALAGLFNGLFAAELSRVLLRSTSLNLSLVVLLVPVLSTLLSLLIVTGGIWALRAALRLAVPGIRLTNLFLVLATLISVLLFAYSSGLLFLIVYLFASGFGTALEVLWNGYIGVIFWGSLLLAGYSLVRTHQAWRIFKIQVQ